MKNRNRQSKVLVSPWVFLTVCFLSVGCSQGFDSLKPEAAINSVQSRPDAAQGDLVQPEPVQPVAETVVTQPPDFHLGICSRLDFSKVVWPSKLPLQERKAMALALNVTGSYEGGAGWANLANNFDGQGLSLGLNQQNLGQNTLQPLFIAFLESNPNLASTLFSKSNLASLRKMLTTWRGSPIRSLEAPADQELFPDNAVLSKLDEGAEQVFEVFDARSSASVAWAKANLFQSSGAFKSDWRKSLTDLAVTAPYRSAQLGEALDMFQRAKGYFSSLGFTELRSLLVMHDFVVQNGGFNKTHLSQFRQFGVSNPRATETERLMKLLEIRLVSVRAQYRNDVRARKSTIINGVGRVHGSQRDLEKEFCSKLRVPVLSPTIPGPA